MRANGIWLKGTSTRKGVTLNIPNCENMVVQAVWEGGKIRTETFNVIRKDVVEKESSFFSIVEAIYNIPRQWWETAVLYFVVLSIFLSLFVCFSNGLFYASVIFIIWDLEESRFTNFVFLVMNIIRNKELKPDKQMYTAMNMGRNAYEKFRRVPTIEEMRKSSKLDKDRIIADYGKETFLSFLIFIGFLFIKITNLYHIYWIDIIKVVIIIALFVLLKDVIEGIGFHQCFEIFFISNPTDEQLEVVRAAIEKVDEDNKKYNDFR